MNIYSLVGPSGCGKTTVLNSLVKRKFSIMKEEYMGSFHSSLNNKQVLSKWNWISRWFERVLDCNDEKIDLIITDRCPIEVVPYAINGNSLMSPILKSFEELKKYHNIDIKTIYLRVDFDELMRRITLRLEKEQDRKQYSETDIEFSKNVFLFYEQYISNIWTYTVNVSEENIETISQSIIELIGKSND